MKTNLIALGSLLATIASAFAITIDFNGSSPMSGPMGNVRIFGSGGVTVAVSAESLVGNTLPWEASYLGIYGGGLGVTNRNEGGGGSGMHTTDNLGSNDRVLFDFSTDVILDRVWLNAFGDTDITVSYRSSGIWTSLEDNYGSDQSRWANINPGNISSSGWAVGGLLPANGWGDSFKIETIDFGLPDMPSPPPTTNTPDSGSTLIVLGLSLMGVGAMRRFVTTS